MDYFVFPHLTKSPYFTKIILYQTPNLHFVQLGSCTTWTLPRSPVINCGQLFTSPSIRRWQSVENLVISCHVRTRPHTLTSAISPWKESPISNPPPTWSWSWPNTHRPPFNDVLSSLHISLFVCNHVIFINYKVSVYTWPRDTNCMPRTVM